MPHKNKDYYLNNKNFKSKVFSDKEKLDKLIKLAETNKYSVIKLSKIFNCDKKSIFAMLYSKGVVISNLGKFKKRYYCNERFFKKLNPVSAYWIGFITADGCLCAKYYSLSIGLNKKDKNHLIKFLGSLNSTNKIRYNKNNNSVNVQVYSKMLVKSLMTYGVIPNKSLKLNNVNIPKNLMSHFIRGVYDGDGSISGKKVTHIQFAIVGTRPFLEQIQEELLEKCNLNKVRIYSTQSRAYRLQYTGSQIFRILDYLYKESVGSIRLDRKYNKYLEFKNKFGGKNETKNN